MDRQTGSIGPIAALSPACSQDEVNTMFDCAKSAQKQWAKTPLWKRAELLKRAAALMREHAAPMAHCLVKEVGVCRGGLNASWAKGPPTRGWD